MLRDAQLILANDTRKDVRKHVLFREAQLPLKISSFPSFATVKHEKPLALLLTVEHLDSYDDVCGHDKKRAESNAISLFPSCEPRAGIIRSYSLRAGTRDAVYIPKRLPTLQLTMGDGMGFANQIYMLLAALLLARATQRALAFPLEMRMRPTASEAFQPVDFDRFFDAQRFTKMLASHVIHRPVERAPANLKATSVWKQHFCDRLAEVYYYEHTVWHVHSPLGAAIPRTEDDYRFALDALGALKPSSRLLRAADQLESLLRNATKEYNGPASFALEQTTLPLLASKSKIKLVVVHVRLESDWARAFPQKLCPPAYIYETLVRHPDVMSENCIVYLMGAVSREHLETLGALDRNKRWCWCTATTFKASWGFEFDEAAVVDREVALRADAFVGFSESTLSLLIHLERFYMDQITRLYAPAFRPADGSMQAMFFYRNSLPLFPFVRQRAP